MLRRAAFVLLVTVLTQSCLLHVYAGESATAKDSSLLNELNSQANTGGTATTPVPVVCNWKPQAAGKTTSTASVTLQSRPLLQKPAIAAVGPRCRP